MTSLDRTFDCTAPIRAVVRNQHGDVIIDLVENAGTVGVTLDTRHPIDLEPVAPTFADGQLVVDLSHADRLNGGHSFPVTIRVEAPAGSDLRVDTGHGDVSAEGRINDGHLTTGLGVISVHEAAALTARSGSGDVSAHRVLGPLDVSTGSGDITVHENNSTVRARTGSGDLTVSSVVQEGTLNSGSGDISIATVHGLVRVSTGSGDISVRELAGGSLQCNTAAGDITIGVRAGIPVWTDVNTLTGRVSSDLQGAGQPREGDAHLEIRASTVTGDISLREVSRVG